jgi:DNA-binding transcriptional LysR family regulator
MTPVRDLNDLYFFAKVADFGSYTAAAKALGLQTSKLSRRIAALEGELGVRLINRTTRRLSLTEAGKTLHRHCLALLDEAQAAKDAMTQLLGSPQGLVRISCPTGLLQGGVADVLARFLAKRPRVRVALDATNRRHHSERRDSLRDARQWRWARLCCCVASNRHGRPGQSAARYPHEKSSRDPSAGTVLALAHGVMLMGIFLCQDSWSAIVAQAVPD